MDEVNVRSHFAVEMREMRSLSGFGEDAIAGSLMRERSLFPV
jgi:hypothetical protein